MGKYSINCEQCNAPEELSVQTQVALDIITMSSVNGIVENYSACLTAVGTQSGQCLDVTRDFQRSVRTPEEIPHAGEAQTESLERFVEGNRELLAAMSSGDQFRCCHEWIAELLFRTRMLPLETQESPRMTPTH
jgi:hypothetical protein